jgi:hypothetical protein
MTDMWELYSLGPGSATPLLYSPVQRESVRETEEETDDTERSVTRGYTTDVQHIYD